MPRWDEVQAALEVLRDAARDANQALSDDRDPGDLADGARALLTFNAAAAHFKFIGDELTKRVSANMETDSAEVPGLARLERTWNRSRTDWQNPDLLKDVLRKAQASTAPHGVLPDTGEVAFTWDQAVAAITRFYNLSGYNVRLKELKSAGLDVADYSTQGPWRARIEAHPLEGNADE